MIREDRDPDFWNSIYEHPEVKPHVSLGMEIEDFGAALQNPAITALRAEHGGFLFFRLDGLGRIYELHTLFTPEGWGKEVYLSAVEAFERMFKAGAQIITTYEVAGNRRSQPPRTFRFRPSGDFAPEPMFNASFRTWVLTRSDWEMSPARQRMHP